MTMNSENTKELYETPAMEIVAFEAEDVITTSYGFDPDSDYE